MLVLLRQRNFVLLWIASLVDSTGDWILLGALPFYVYRLTGSALASGAMFTAIMLPYVLFGSIGGVFVDRWELRHVIITTSLINAVLVLLLLAVQSAAWVWVVYVVAFGQSCLGVFVGPAQGAFLPRLVGRQHLVNANALQGQTSYIGRLLGPALGGMLLATLGLRSVVIADCASFLLAAVLVIGIVLPRTPASVAAAHVERGHRLWMQTWQDWLEGLRLIATRPLVLTVFTVDGLEGLADGIFQVVFVVFVRVVLSGGAEQFGWVMSASALGRIIGGTLIARIGHRLRPAYLISVLLFNGTFVLLWVHLSTLWLILLLFALGGVSYAAYNVGVTNTLQESVPEQFLGRVFGSYLTVRTFLVVAGQIAAGLLATTENSQTLLTVNGALVLLAGTIALLSVRQYTATLSRGSAASVQDLP